MKPHIEIRTDKPDELLGALEQYQQNLKRLKVSRGGMGLLAPLEAAQIRLVETEHQGFANYETAIVALTLDNDRTGLSAVLHGVRKCQLHQDKRRLAEFGAESALEMDVADGIKEAFDYAIPELPSPFSELLGAGLESVDWLDLARHYIDKVKQGVSV